MIPCRFFLPLYSSTPTRELRARPRRVRTALTSGVRRRASGLRRHRWPRRWRRRSDATNVLAAKPRAARRRLRFLRRLFGFPGVNYRLVFFYPLKFFRGLKTNPFPERSDKAAKLLSKKSRSSSSQRFCVYSAVVVCFPAEVSPRGLAERAEDGAAVHGTPLLAVAAEEGADSQRVWEAPEAARFKDRTHPQGPRRNRPCRHPDFAPAGPDLGPEL